MATGNPAVDPAMVDPAIEPEPTGPAEPVSTGSGAIAAGFDQKGHVRRTRISGVWVGLIAAAIFLILLIIFIAQNQAKARIHFLGWSGQLSVGLTIVAASLCGLFIASIPGSVRILQLRRALKKNTPRDQRLPH